VDEFFWRMQDYGLWTWTCRKKVNGEGMLMSTFASRLLMLTTILVDHESHTSPLGKATQNSSFNDFLIFVHIPMLSHSHIIEINTHD
jgi:hypothetical protein